MKTFIFRLETLLLKPFNSKLLNHFKTDYGVIFGGITDFNNRDVNQMLYKLYSEHQVTFDYISYSNHKIHDKAFIISHRNIDFVVPENTTVRLNTEFVIPRFKTDHEIESIDELEEIFFNRKN